MSDLADTLHGVHLVSYCLYTPCFTCFLIRYISLGISIDSLFHAYLHCGDRTTFYSNLKDINPLSNTAQCLFWDTWQCCPNSSDEVKYYQFSSILFSKTGIWFIKGQSGLLCARSNHQYWMFLMLQTYHSVDWEWPTSLLLTAVGLRIHKIKLSLFGTACNKVCSFSIMCLSDQVLTYIIQIIIIFIKPCTSSWRDPGLPTHALHYQ